MGRHGEKERGVAACNETQRGTYIFIGSDRGDIALVKICAETLVKKKNWALHDIIQNGMCANGLEICLCNYNNFF